MNRFISVLLTLAVIGCEGTSNMSKLPVLGRKKIVERMVDGNTVADTLDHTVATFQFVNQDSVLISNTTFEDKIYVADFFFTSCPTICPVMKKQMLRVYEQYENQEKVNILSHTIDPSYDDVKVLKDYSEALGVNAPKWNFVTGAQDEIYTLAESSYMVTAGEDEQAAGGFIHSGAFMLVDPLGRIRGVYDGTQADQVDILLNDIERLLREFPDEE